MNDFDGTPGTQGGMGVGEDLEVDAFVRFVGDINELRVHPTAVVSAGAQLGRGVVLGPRVFIAENVVIGEGTRVEAGSFIGCQTHVGAGCRLGNNITLRERTVLGNRVIVGSGAVIGSDGFGFADCTDGNKMKMPQVGHVEIGDDSVISAKATIDRATLGSTLLGMRVHVGALAQVAHNCQIGDDTVIGPRAGICGSAIIGDRVRLGACVGVIGHIKVGDDAVVLDGAGVTHSIKNGVTVAGFPAMSLKHYQERNQVLPRIPDLLERLRRLEQAMLTLTAGRDS